MEERKYILGERVQLLFETPNDARYWFGYYNYCPIDDSGKRLLAHKWQSQDEEREFNQSDTLDIGWFDLDTGAWHYIAGSRSCNWQQGAMTQWIHIDGKQRIIFNDAEDNKYVARIYDLDGSFFKTLPAAIYGINEREGFSITINFERAYWCRTYHYQFIRDESYNKQITEVDGVYKLDFNTGCLDKIIDIQEIINYDYQPEFASGKHWVEHIMLSPNGKTFAFYHRFDCGEGFRTRCFIADIEGRIIGMLKDWETVSWSHLGWMDDDTFVIYGIKRKVFGAMYSAVTFNSGKLGILLRRMYRRFFAKHVTPQIHNKLATGKGYEVYKTDGSKLGMFDAGLLINDGHPSFSKDQKYMLTDTYALNDGYRYLLMFHTGKKELKELGKFFSPINATAYRSDLHPRFGQNRDIVIIDTAHTGRHGIQVLKVNEIYEND